MMLWFSRHRRLREQLSAHIDGELDPRAAARLEAHLAACESCRVEMEQLRATVAALQGLPQADLPRSFVLSPDRVAARPAPRSTQTLAFGMRLAAAGVAVALAAVVIADLGGLAGDGTGRDASMPEMLSERQADEAAMEGGGLEPVADPNMFGMLEPEDSEIVTGDSGPGFADAAGGGTPAAGEIQGRVTEEDAAAPSPAPMLPPDVTVVPEGADGGGVPSGATSSPEAGVREAAPASTGDGGGVDALTAAEIGLAAALGLLVGGGVVLTFVGRKR